jgi:hypothetical protein
MNAQQAEVAGRIAEISGWDMDENFFVEKTLLQSHGNGNKADLRARLRIGSLVFVRVFDLKSMDRAVPMTYQVSGIKAGAGDADLGGDAREVEMIRLRPRETAPRMLLQFTFRETLLN